MTFVAALDNTLNARVAEAVRGLLKSAGIAYAAAADAHIEGILAEPPPAQPSAGESAGAGPAPSAAPAPSAPPNPPPSAPRGAGVRVSFGSSLSTAGVLFVGGMSQYTNVGFAATLGAGAAFLWKTWSLGVDGRFQLIRAFTNAGVIGGPLYYFLLGPDVQVGIGRAGSLRLTGDLSGGAALVSIFGQAGSLTKTRPYADAGLYGGISLGKWLTLGAEARFTMIFDEEVLVMGVSPAVSLRMEL